jgi:hypothetical protein
MRRSLKHNPRARWLAAILLACPVLWGCGPPSARDLPLDKALAKQSLTAALDAWKAGEKAAALKDRTPPIVVGVPVWDGGAKLTDYKIVSETDAGANLHLEVELTMDRGGQATTSQATFIVSTSPAITVFTD